MATPLTSHFRNCPHCGVTKAHMILQADFTAEAASGRKRPYGVFSCPLCAGLVAVESYDDPVQGVREIGQIPRHEGTGIQHLPEKVERFFVQAQTAMSAGLADSAAVELRRALEAACAARGHQKKTLVSSIESLVSEGLITTEFTPALSHVRKLGNVGAHASDEELLLDEVRLTLRFTEQVLRNLFEIPGELKLLEGDGTEGDRGSDGS